MIHHPVPFSCTYAILSAILKRADVGQSWPHGAARTGKNRKWRKTAKRFSGSCSSSSCCRRRILPSSYRSSRRLSLIMNCSAASKCACCKTSTTRRSSFRSSITRSTRRSRQAGSRSPEIPGCRPFCRPGGGCFPAPSKSIFSAKSKRKAPITNNRAIYYPLPRKGRREKFAAPNRKISRRIEPAEVGRKPFAGEQRHGFVERQADHVGVGADQLDDKCAGEALRRIAAGLAAPLAGTEIGFHVLK